MIDPSLQSNQLFEIDDGYDARSHFSIPKHVQEIFHDPNHGGFCLRPLTSAFQQQTTEGGSYTYMKDINKTKISVNNISL